MLWVTGILFLILNSLLYFKMTSERAKFKQTISQQAELLTNADKMAALGEMAAGIVHEIQNPLTSVILQASFLKSKGAELQKSPELLKKLHERLEKDVLRMDRIIKSVQRISREANSMEKEIISLRTLLEDAHDLCGERLQTRGIRFSVHYTSADGDPSDRDLLISCNSTQILQVLANLLNNSIDAIEPLKERWIKITTFSKKGSKEIEVAITDSGNGIPAQTQLKMMQPFFTTKPFGKGTGLGLSIAKKIVDAHQGTLVLDQESPYTRFVLKIPITTQGSSELTAALLQKSCSQPDRHIEVSPDGSP